jgi:hypothetical protein
MAEWIKQATVVAGDEFVGLYAAGGSFNVVSAPGDSFVGVYHASGAYWVTGTDDEDHPFYAEDGSIFVLNSTLAG